jgi:general secretion pathway protein E
MYNRQRLGEMLVRMQKATQAQVDRALRTQHDKGGRIGEILVAMEAISPATLAQALAEQLDLDWAPELPTDSVEIELLAELQLAYCRDRRVLPIRQQDDLVIVGTDDPLDVDALDELSFMLGAPVEALLIPSDVLVNTINNVFEKKDRQFGAGFGDLDEAESPAAEEMSSLDIKDLLDAGDDDEAPVIRFVNSLFVQAVRERCSDIHIEPGEKELMVRFRIDGVLKAVANPPKRFLSSIITRVKIMAGLNIAEKRLPQDGRIRIKMAGKDIDIRVATAPMVHGERITMRLLDKSSVLLNVRDIGFAPDHLEHIIRFINRPHGIILVTGPTGSGKTTTLYSCLSEINRPDRNILTIEDPVEYQLPGISQMQVNSKIELTFASGLRSYLRHDPDVIMVGEIRDEETAGMAIQASLTGHLVFSTLHTNDSAGAFTRLIEMGIEPFLVSSTVIATMAQRLIRRVCSKCREPYMPSEEELAKIGITQRDVRERGVDGMVFQARVGGCDYCVGLGYRGRSGIYELLPVDNAVRTLVMNRSDSGAIKDEACKRGMRTLREDGALKVLKGMTTIEEVMRVTVEGEAHD